MYTYYLLAITEGQFQQDDLILLGLLVSGVVIIAMHVRRLNRDLMHYKKLLEEQVRFNQKLNQAIERILKIDETGGIDSNRRQHNKRKH